MFYRQLRMGLDGTPFRIVKFRTMIPDAEALTGPRFATPRRPAHHAASGRCCAATPWTSCRSSGTCSRARCRWSARAPSGPEFVARFRERYPEYMSRHRVRAGITGWAQVHDLRGQSSIRKRIAHDLYYIDNWSLALDFKIMWLTLLRFWRHRHAY